MKSENPGASLKKFIEETKWLLKSVV
jgi:hypothetical protein